MARSPKTRAAGRRAGVDARKSPACGQLDRARKPAEPKPAAAAEAPGASASRASGQDRARADTPTHRPKPSGSGRREARRTINKEFESFDAFVSEYVSNLSRSGVFVRTRKPLPVGTKVDLRFTVLMDDVEIVEGVGEVVRVHDDPAGMGLVFRELSGYSEAIIERLLTSQPLGGSKKQ